MTANKLPFSRVKVVMPPVNEKNNMDCHFFRLIDSDELEGGLVADLGTLLVPLCSNFGWPVFFFLLARICPTSGEETKSILSQSASICPGAKLGTKVSTYLPLILDRFCARREDHGMDHKRMREKWIRKVL